MLIFLWAPFLIKATDLGTALQGDLRILSNRFTGEVPVSIASRPAIHMLRAPKPRPARNLGLPPKHSETLEEAAALRSMVLERSQKPCPCLGCFCFLSRPVQRNPHGMEDHFRIRRLKWVANTPKQTLNRTLNKTLKDP